jgi:metal-responsive CopG/Arc/MetJ family transcriptional regulator
MEKQNITLSLPKDLLVKVKVVAAERQTSVSSLLTQSLRHLVDQSDEYQRAKQRHLRALERGYDLGTQGKITITRDELHERR